jgi:hypothetical protein
MGIRLRRKSDGLTIDWESVSCKSDVSYSDEYEKANLPEFMRRDYDILTKEDKAATTTTGTVIVPEGGWASLTLENFEEKMGYRFRIDGDQAARQLPREVAFLQFLESKGIKRETRLIPDLTLDNFREKTGQRFRMTKEDIARNLTREQAFEQWKKRNGY